MENILPAGRTRRLIHGSVLAGLTLVLAIALVARAAGPWWFALIFLFALLGTLQLLQARDRT